MHSWAVIWQYSHHYNRYQARAILHHFHHVLIQVIYNISCLNKLMTILLTSAPKQVQLN